MRLMCLLFLWSSPIDILPTIVAAAGGVIDEERTQDPFIFRGQPCDSGVRATLSDGATAADPAISGADSTSSGACSSAQQRRSHIFEQTKKDINHRHCDSTSTQGASCDIDQRRPH